MKIAILFDDRRNDTTGNYIKKSLAARTNDDFQVFHTATPLWGHLKEDDHDLYIVIDDGVKCEWPEHKYHPSVYWAIDTHLDPEWRIEQCKRAKIDHVFCAQKDGAELFRQNHINASWMPLACDPDIHSLKETFDKQYDVCFVGHVDPKWMDTRVEFLDEIFKAYPNFYFGQRFIKEATEIYKKSRIILNQSVKNDINMRVFEASCSGSLLLTNRIQDNGMEELFTEGLNIVTFRGVQDAITKIGQYLHDGMSRESTADLASLHVKMYHTYNHRCDKILEVAEQKGWICDPPYLTKFFKESKQDGTKTPCQVSNY